MLLRIIIVVSMTIVCNGIKVPVNSSEDKVQPTNDPTSAPTQIAPIYYVGDDDEDNVDSYLVPPNPHTQETVGSDNSDKATLPTYLLPPTPEQQSEFYYNPTEPGKQTDWLPIAQNVPTPPQNIDQNLNQSENSQEHKRKTKSHDSIVVPVPATGLEPPRIEAPNEYFASPSAGEIPVQEIQRPFLISVEENRRPINIPQPVRYEIPIIVSNKELPINYRRKPIETSLPLHLIPPQPESYKVPTKLYPKKYGGEYRPVAIPIAQYLDGSALEIPRAKPAKLFKPLPSSEIDYLTPTDEKINYFYRKAEHQRKLKGDVLRQEQAIEDLPQSQPIYSKYNEPPSTEHGASELNYKHPEPLSTEQEASETNFRHPGRNAYPAPLRATSPPQHDSAAPAPDGRTEFRMHGMKGPHSYQFGFDTGKGKNRQFRYEERDNDGKVQGHYGYMDKRGKLRVVNYSADPKTGFHAEAPLEKE